MRKISDITPTATAEGEFTEGSVATGIAPTILPAEWFNVIQRELVNIVLTAGMKLDPKNDNQILLALQKLLPSIDSVKAKQDKDATLTALAGLATGENKLPYFTGTDTASQTDLTGVGRDIIGKLSVADVLSYLGLGEAAKLPAASAMTSYAGWLSVPVVIDGEQRNFILQWKQVTVPKSPDGSMQTVTSSWPVAFPTGCFSIMQALTNSLIYSSSGTPFSSATITDRATFTAASAYSKSPSTVTVWGVGF